MESSILLPPRIDDVPPPGVAIVEELDKKLLVQLRDGRKIIGTLRSFDQFANLVLEGW
jgi:U6 snRNA-associated Sm-like protein LSm1